MKFGRLHDTRFPNLDNVDVYAYKNEFDYTRWVAGTKIKLCNVLWNADYSDVARFTTNIERDRWFDELNDYYTIELDSDRAYVPEQAIKIPVPYDVAARFNYMVVTIPVLPGSNPPINYENQEVGIRRWYFFVNSIDYRAANSTACRLSLDVWTQYQNDVEIKYLMLERGHAPVAASDVDAYLKNPIANNDYILAPDVTPSDSQIVRSANYIPFGNGVKYVCFASVCPISELSKLGSVKHNDSEYTFGNITYSDVDARYGYQLEVHGFKVGNGDNYSALNTRVKSFGSTQEFIPNGSYMYAIPAASANDFVNTVMHDCPVFFRTILACFMVDADMLTFGQSVTFNGFGIYECVGKNQNIDITLTKEMFGFPEEYQHLAKLYTFPYSEIEITDNVGESVTVRIENTGSIVAHKDTMLAYPFLDARIWFDGINGTGSQNYAWIDMNGTSHQKEMPNSDWSKICFDLDIPCYAIYMDGNTAWYLDNFNSGLRGNAKRALAAYHDAVRSANTARANAVDSNNTMYANTDRDATTLTTNTNNTANCNRSNADLTIAANTTNTNNSNHSSEECTTFSNSGLERKTSNSNTVSIATTIVENQTTAAVSTTNAAASAQTGAIGGAMAGVGLGATIGAAGGPIGIAGGAAIGALGSIIGGVIGYGCAETTAGIVLNGQETSVSLMNQANNANVGISQGVADNITESQNQLRTKTNTTNNNAFSAQTDNTNATSRANAGNTAATMRANSDATRDTGNANAGYTREVGVLNAKENLESTHLALQYTLNDAKMRAPIQVTAERGNYLSYYAGNNGVQFKIKTMPNGDIRQIGDTFMRYGYALNQIWDLEKSGLCPMPHFCYWKAGDIWVDDRKSSNNLIQETMVSIFMRGVTVWNNPDEIGKVSIYANK